MKNDFTHCTACNSLITIKTKMCRDEIVTYI